MLKWRISLIKGFSIPCMKSSKRMIQHSQMLFRSCENFSSSDFPSPTSDYLQIKSPSMYSLEFFVSVSFRTFLLKFCQALCSISAEVSTQSFYSDYFSFIILNPRGTHSSVQRYSQAYSFTKFLRNLSAMFYFFQASASLITFE
ncbi:hypothetical protein FGO68_gene11248 [Halteria grandinella]|uniref:Uncharacterized protein n=1 Tax=Halteria grandinella TaxID=5974 RepID=A0A8J8P4Q4_HALGN|nr:hypothetical protein FGO68_gene11248 [Halteria grandinella]